MSQKFEADDPVEVRATGRRGIVLMVPALEFEGDGLPTHFVEFEDSSIGVFWPSELDLADGDTA